MTVPLLEDTEDVVAHRRQWRYNGELRPGFAHKPGPGQESVWDYPRPPALQPVKKLLEVRYRDVLIASTTAGVRVCETAGAPTYYFPPYDVVAELSGDGGSSVCEWKGVAEALSMPSQENVGWRYIKMFRGYESLYNWVSFYPKKVDCFVAGEAVTPQPGGFYGGWVTRDIVGPIKGEPGING